jgi:hypothetical protein
MLPNNLLALKSIEGCGTLLPYITLISIAVAERLNKI